MTVYPNADPRTLADSHRRMLFEESGIDPGVAAERGVRTIAHGRELPEGFSHRQRRRGGGILFIGHRPNGETSYSYRPDAPDPERPGHKYEQPCKHLGAPGNVLDIHPSVRHLKDDVGVPVVFCEGIKKADSIISAARREGVAVLVVAITGAYARLDAAFRCLVGRARLVALQKNRYWCTPDGLSLDAGPFVAALEYASGERATVVGKPEAGFFRVALEDLGLEAGEVAIIGDGAQVDVAGAKRAGLLGIQVRTGKWRPGSEERDADLVLDTVAGLPEALGVRKGEG